jgi:putative lipoprotein
VKPVPEEENVMVYRYTRLLVLLLLAATPGCTLPVNEGGGDALITGTVVYRERMALSPDAVVRVTLEDVSKTDVPSILIAETRFKASGGPPYAFALAYDPAGIDSRNRYTLRATIRDRERLMFTSTEHIEPFGSDAVEILVRRAGG